MRVFISGPMKGLPLHNYPAFDRAEATLRSFGFEVVNPAAIGRHYGIHAQCPADQDTVKTLLLSDLAALAYCDAIYLLPGWQKSLGVAVELAMSQYVGIPAFERITDILVYREGRAA